LFLCGTFAVRKELFLAVGGYTERLAYAENSDLALRLVSRCKEQSLEIVSISKPLVLYHKTSPRPDQEHFQLRLETARFFLEQHGQRYRAKQPEAFANHCAIAGVNAARLGDFPEARKFFLHAIEADPLHWKNYGRLFLALLPDVACKVWL
jgi:hypothetical protein